MKKPPKKDLESSESPDASAPQKAASKKPKEKKKMTLPVQIGLVVLVCISVPGAMHLFTKMATKSAINCLPPTRSVGSAPPFGIRQYCVYGEKTKHGPSKAWWPNGKVQSESFYEKSKKNGTFRRWHPNGQMSSEGTYSLGLKQGVWKEWSPKGQLTIATTYQDGYMNGPRYFYNTAGKLTAEFDYAGGILMEGADESDSEQ